MPPRGIHAKFKGQYQLQADTGRFTFTGFAATFDYESTPPLALSGSLPGATQNSPYSASLVASGGKLPYGWTASGLPATLTINASTGAITGTPTDVATYSVVVTVRDANNTSAPAAQSLVVRSAGAAPVTFGQLIAQGGVAPAGQVNVRNRWSDNSPQFALVTTGGPSSGPNVTHGTTIVVDYPPFGSATMTVPVETTASGPAMSSFLYRGQIGTDAHLRAYAEVRKYADGSIVPMVWIENCYTFVTNPTNKDGTATVTVNGTVLYGPAALSLKHQTRCVLVTPPAVDGGPEAWKQLIELRYAPPYAFKNPHTDIVFQPYVPTQRGNLPAAMDDTGSQDYIGIVGRWDALYCGSGLYLQTVVDAAMQAGIYSVHYRDEATEYPFLPSKKWDIWLQTGYNDPRSVPSYTGGGNATPDMAHHPSAGFIAYLATGWRYFLEELQFWGFWTWGYPAWSARGPGHGRLPPQTRARAWNTRTWGQIVLISDAASQFRADFLAILQDAINYEKAISVDGSVLNGVWKNNLGAPQFYTQGYSLDPFGSTDGYYKAPAFQDYFYKLAFAYVSELPFDLGTQARADLTALLQFTYKEVIGLMGHGWPWRRAGDYAIRYGREDLVNGQTAWPNPWYATWADAWASMGIETPDPTPGLAFIGLTSTFEKSYVANMMPALAYAVRHGATNAQESWDLLTSSFDFQAYSYKFNDFPNWGITPGSSVIAAAWRRNWPYGVGVWAPITNADGSGTSISKMPIATRPTNAGYIDNYTNLAAVGTQWWAVAGGGHQYDGNNSVNYIDFADDVPMWKRATRPDGVMDGAPSAGPTTMGAYQADGRPTAAHTETAMLYCAPLHTVMRCNAYGYYNEGGGYGKLDGFNVLTNQWAPAGTYADKMDFDSSPVYAGNAINPATGDIYSSDIDNLRWYCWRAATNQWEDARIQLTRGVVLGYIDVTHGRRDVNAGKEGRFIPGFDYSRNNSIATFPYIDIKTPAARTPGSIDGQVLVTTGLDPLLFSYEQGRLTVTHDQTNDYYYFLQAHNPPRVFRVNAGTAVIGAAWSGVEVTPSGSNIIGATALPTCASGHSTRFQWFPPPIGGIMFYPSYSTDIWFMRTE